jgi:hypothetical protein
VRELLGSSGTRTQFGSLQSSQMPCHLPPQTLLHRSTGSAQGLLGGIRTLCYLRDADGIRGNHAMGDGRKGKGSLTSTFHRTHTEPLFPSVILSEFLRGGRRGYASARHTRRATDEYASASEEAVQVRRRKPRPIFNIRQ